jgi:hypothetical protein
MASAFDIDDATLDPTSRVRQMSMTSHTPASPMSANSDSQRGDIFLQNGSGPVLISDNRRPSQVSANGRYPPTLNSASPSEGYQSSDGPSPGANNKTMRRGQRYDPIRGGIFESKPQALAPPSAGFGTFNDNFEQFPVDFHDNSFLPHNPGSPLTVYPQHLGNGNNQPWVPYHSLPQGNTRHLINAPQPPSIRVIGTTGRDLTPPHADAGQPQASPLHLNTNFDFAHAIDTQGSPDTASIQVPQNAVKHKRTSSINSTSNMPTVVSMGPRSPLLSPTSGERSPIATNPASATRGRYPPTAVELRARDLNLHPHDTDSQAVDITRRAPRTYRVNDDRNGYWVHAYVNEQLVRAFPDNGSALNLVSEAYACREGLGQPIGTGPSILLPNNELANSAGILTVLFRFTKEDVARPVAFTVLRDCIHDFILSATLLTESQTFTKYRNRIQRAPSVLQVPIRVCFNGRPLQSVVGSINGHRVIANPDTGSNVNVIEKSLANLFDFHISSDSEDDVLQFVDGSLLKPLGIVRGVVWRYGETQAEQPPPPHSHAKSTEVALQECRYGTDAAHDDSFVCDFYVLDSMPVPVILGSGLLYGTKDFTDCVEHIAHDGDPIDSENPSYPVAPINKLFWQKRKKRKRDLAPGKKTSASLVQLSYHD